MENKLKIGLRQEFLNEDPTVSLTAMIGYYVGAETWNDEMAKAKKYDGQDVTFNLTSCYKKLELDFAVGDSMELQNSLHKLDTIISVCESMKRDLVLLNKVVEEGKEYRKELDKAREKENN